MTPRQAAIAAWFASHYPDTHVIPAGTYDRVMQELGENYGMVAGMCGYRTDWNKQQPQAAWLQRLKEEAS